MAKGKQKGFSLIEIMIGAGLMVLVVSAGYKALQYMNVEVFSSFRRQSRANEMDIMRTHVMRFLSPGTLRLYAMSGKVPPSDQSLARLLVPLPGRCADLSPPSSTCAANGSTAVLYVSYPKPNPAAITAACGLAWNAWMVDSGDTAYGTTSYAGDAFTINVSGQPADTIRTGGERILGLVNAPVVSLWRSVSAGTPMNIYQSPPGSGTWYYDSSSGMTPLPAECSAQFRRDGGGNPIVNQMIRLEVAPVHLAQFTGGPQNYSASDLVQAQGTFPMRIAPLNLRSIGIQQEEKVPVRTPPVYENRLSIKNCTFSGDRIACGGQSFLSFGPIAGVSVSETFDSDLRNAPAGATRFEIFNSVTPVSASCAANCAGLPLPDTANIPVLLNGTEVISQLDASQFSLLKQEAITGVQFKVRFDSGPEETIDVPIK